MNRGHSVRKHVELSTYFWPGRIFRASAVKQEHFKLTANNTTGISLSSCIVTGQIVNLTK